MRISVNLNEETLKRVDEEAKRLGTSRGSMLTAWIGEKLYAIESSRSWLDENFQEKLIGALKDSLLNLEMEEANKNVKSNFKPIKKSAK